MPPGSSKTTMLPLMGCLDRPDSGTVHLKGRDVSAAGANERADLRRD
jgi:ABC-type lipoprotein export system ATPase subunit